MNKTLNGQTLQIDKEEDYLTEAYEQIKHRLCNDYLILSANQSYDGTKKEHMEKALGMVKGNSSAESIDFKTNLASLFYCLVIPALWRMTKTIFEVEQNKFAFVIQSSKEYGERTLIYGPGFHIVGYDYKLEGIYSLNQSFDNNLIESSIGDIKIAKVEQGFIMVLAWGGQNVILGPGIHKITEPMKLIKYMNLESFFINAGPEKWITIPTGYDGISLNRGSIKILEGGKQHYLAHVSEKFIKMVPKTLQTDKIVSDIPTYVYNLTSSQKSTGTNRMNYDPTVFLSTSTAEGSKVIIDCMVQWYIVDTKLASLTAMEILKVDSFGDEATNEQAAISASSKNICNLRKTVLRIAKNHLTAMVGSISLSGKQSMSAQVKEKGDVNVIFDDSQSLKLKQQFSNKNDNSNKNKQLSNFDILSSLQGKTNYLKDSLNQDLSHIGCIAEAVSIYKVTPSQEIQQELDKQTKARVDANTAIIQALSNQKSQRINVQISSRNAKIKADSDKNVMLMEANSFSDAQIAKAKGQADAITSVAQARHEEAINLEKSIIARNLATTRVAGEAVAKIFKGKNQFTFGNSPGDVLFNMFGNQGQQK